MKERSREVDLPQMRGGKPCDELDLKQTLSCESGSGRCTSK